MNSDGVDQSRRRVLTFSTAVVGAVGGVFTAVPFLSSFNPSAKAKSAGAPVLVDLSKIDVGGYMRVKFQGQPVYVVRRTEEALKDIAASADIVADPDSALSSQPSYTENTHRSINPEFLIVLGLCTHLGCVPIYKSEKGAISTGHIGGFFCPCHGSKFDLAGRVYKAVPAEFNLAIPKHYYVDSETVMIGVDAEEGKA